jgi:hypothetical protein
LLLTTLCALLSGLLHTFLELCSSHVINVVNALHLKADIDWSGNSNSTACA